MQPNGCERTARLMEVTWIAGQPSSLEFRPPFQHAPYGHWSSTRQMQKYLQEGRTTQGRQVSRCATNAQHTIGNRASLLDKIRAVRILGGTVISENRFWIVKWLAPKVFAIAKSLMLCHIVDANALIMNSRGTYNLQRVREIIRAHSQWTFLPLSRLSEYRQGSSLPPEAALHQSGNPPFRGLS